MHVNVKENSILLVDGNAIFIEISVSHFSIETKKFCLPKYEDLLDKITFNPAACLSENSA